MFKVDNGSNIKQTRPVKLITSWAMLELALVSYDILVVFLCALIDSKTCEQLHR